MTSVEEQYSILDKAEAYIRSKIQGPLSKPKTLIIAGSGLSGISDLLSEQFEVPYTDIPGFKASTVSGHAGKLIFGYIGDNKVPVVCMAGRLHFYEGYTFEETTFPIRLAKQLDVEMVVVTNAAGGINANFKAGDLMIIYDHINFPGLSGWHPLRGPNLEKFGPRFQPLSDAYDLELRQLFFQQKEKLGIQRSIHEGTYFYAAGPTYESRSESRLIRTLGGDAVGMSTVPEVIVARHCGLRVLALSLITNECVVDPPASAFDKNPKALDEGMATHEEVLEYANQASKDVQKIIEATVNEF
ncbi:Purine nucleoside phosphorylase [Wickerhamomyces ciferrii]|uniref:Purine nucleoside phosphorylase n=1 Tax=Wickerhamomyces ciferrii (strain ATCC 14091 / BCRC 22168 / CBS 111 / JCM 3599 / NBRC 0793 / NRRL Y-1031 F-60-10) TaxID=1206466 RepID=K0KR31_WICCF|nr:Purine nucleoside phosphorylase [Wickerhamomyces ciferrii]CCH43749.1 Purine nucleoside phosphorylase [Wickerhamomyces ciferrii]